MIAAFYETNGIARKVLRVGRVPEPEPGPGEVRIRLHTSGVNPSDVKRRAGLQGKVEFPRVIPHSDGAGVIDRVGPGVPEARLGQRVWTWNAQWKRADGTAAEYVTLPGEQAVELPDGTSFEEGACFGIPLLTAWQAVHAGDGISGKTVLVAGGAGAVGHYAVQLARLAGARVIATVSSDAKELHARAAGAESVVNYRTEDVGARVQELTGGAGVARILEVDAAVNAPLWPHVLAPFGEVVVYGTSQVEAKLPVRSLMARSQVLRGIFVYEMPPALRRHAIEDLTGLLEHGQLQHAVAIRVPLPEIAHAHELVEEGTVVGNVVVSITGEAP